MKNFCIFLLLEIFAAKTLAFGEDTPPNMNGQYRDVDNVAEMIFQSCAASSNNANFDASTLLKCF